MALNRTFDDTNPAERSESENEMPELMKDECPCDECRQVEGPTGDDRTSHRSCSTATCSPTLPYAWSDRESISGDTDLKEPAGDNIDPLPPTLSQPVKRHLSNSTSPQDSGACCAKVPRLASEGHNLQVVVQDMDHKQSGNVLDLQEDQMKPSQSGLPQNDGNKSESDVEVVAVIPAQQPNLANAYDSDDVQIVGYESPRALNGTNDPFLPVISISSDNEDYLPDLPEVEPLYQNQMADPRLQAAYDADLEGKFYT